MCCRTAARGQPAKRLSTKEHGLRLFPTVSRRWHLARIHDALYVDCRDLEGREPQPTAAIIDSQSVKTGPNALDEIGYDAGKKVKGRKRHILVDTVGLLLQLRRAFGGHTGPRRCLPPVRQADNALSIPSGHLC